VEFELFKTSTRREGEVGDSEGDLIMRYNRQANPKRSFMQNRQNH